MWSAQGGRMKRRDGGRYRTGVHTDSPVWSRAALPAMYVHCQTGLYGKCLISSWHLRRAGLRRGRSDFICRNWRSLNKQDPPQLSSGKLKNGKKNKMWLFFFITALRWIGKLLNLIRITNICSVNQWVQKNGERSWSGSGWMRCFGEPPHTKWRKISGDSYEMGFNVNSLFNSCNSLRD